MGLGVFVLSEMLLVLSSTLVLPYISAGRKGGGDAAFLSHSSVPAELQAEPFSTLCSLSGCLTFGHLFMA